MLRLECLRCGGGIYITSPEEGLDVTCMCGAEYTLTRSSNPEWDVIAAGLIGFIAGTFLGPLIPALSVAVMKKVVPPG